MIPYTTTRDTTLEEARLLLALDFAGALVDVSQPLRLRFGTAGKRRSHTPDFLAVTRSGVWLIDVRPEPLIKEEDRESFAAAAEVALACGWHYVVAARWRDHVLSALDALSSRRRPLSDPLGLWPPASGPSTPSPICHPASRSFKSSSSSTRTDSQRRSTTATAEVRGGTRA